MPARRARASNVELSCRTGWSSEPRHDAITSKMTLEISVIICTHNPREDYLRRVLKALRAQSLSAEQWELLLIDNASKEPLAAAWDLSCSPAAAASARRTWA